MPIYKNWDDLLSSVNTKAYAGASSLIAAVRKLHPSGVDQILVGESTKSSYKVATRRNGLVVILVGLWLPALRRIDAPNSADSQLLRGALKPTGAVGVVMGDGSVRLLLGIKPPTGFDAPKLDADSGME
jgi:hypothetical protein